MGPRSTAPGDAESPTARLVDVTFSILKHQAALKQHNCGLLFDKLLKAAPIVRLGPPTCGLREALMRLPATFALRNTSRGWVVRLRSNAERPRPPVPRVRRFPQRLPSDLCSLSPTCSAGSQADSPTLAASQPTRGRNRGTVVAAARPPPPQPPARLPPPVLTRVAVPSPSCSPDSSAPTSPPPSPMPYEQLVPASPMVLSGRYHVWSGVVDLHSRPSTGSAGVLPPGLAATHARAEMEERRALNGPPPEPSGSGRVRIRRAANATQDLASNTSRVASGGGAASRSRTRSVARAQECH
eukprot:NODE_14712_length_1091_cov_4.532158.p1 GENE.NODE_14712_length_1091_cov_4.532158~~NODE_14712_length_1091_cov_4.532158.p1  ORF type:complete len:345 (-),score=68.50 NODE_14712_length_1091_cov_4.532158:55-948(-)